MPSVLFVCTANQIRSPMGAALLQDILQKTGRMDDWQVESAGTWAEPGLPPVPAAVRVMRERGIDISHHRARTVTDALLTAFDLVLVMTHDHQEALRVEFPKLTLRVHLLSELVNGSWDVDDPIDQTAPELRTLANHMDRVLRDGFDRLIALVQVSGESRNLA